MSSSISAASNPAPRKLRTLQSYWPLGLAFVLALVLLPLSYMLLELHNSPATRALQQGVLLGQLVFLGLLGGLLAPHWIIGYAIVIVLTLVGSAIVWQVTGHEANILRRVPWFWRACHLPCSCLIAISPLLALRSVSRVRISVDRDLKRRTGMEDYVVVAIVIGCASLLAAIPTMIMRTYTDLAGRFEDRSDVFGLIGYELRFALLGIVCLTAGVPLAYLILRPANKVAMSWKHLLSYSTALVGFGAAIQFSRDLGLEQAANTALTLATACGLVVLGLIATRSSGLFLFSRTDETSELTRNKSDNILPTNQATSHIQSEAALMSVGLWLPRLLVVILLSLVAYAGYSLYDRQQQVHLAHQQYDAFKRGIVSKGGNVDGTTLQTISSVSLGPDAIDSDLQQLTQCRFISQLSLSGSKVTESGINQLASLRRLSVLDLSDTQIGDDAVQLISRTLPQLTALNLSNTQVTVAGINSLKRNRLEELNLSHLNLTDVQFSEIDLNYRTSLFVHHNPLTEKSLPKLTRFRGIGIGANNFAEGWWSMISEVPDTLLLQGPDINDQVLQSIGQNADNMDQLVIRDSSVTDAGLKHLSGIRINILVLAGDQFTDDGVADASLQVGYGLGLSGNLTGACLMNWELPNLQVLDLSNSQVDDQSLAKLTLPPKLRYLGLRNTSVTDKSLQVLSGSNVSAIDLVDTKVIGDFIVQNHRLKRVQITTGSVNSDGLRLARDLGIAISQVDSSKHIIQ